MSEHFFTSNMVFMDQDQGKLKLVQLATWHELGWKRGETYASSYWLVVRQALIEGLMAQLLVMLVGLLLPFYVYRTKTGIHWRCSRSEEHEIWRGDLQQSCQAPGAMSCRGSRKFKGDDMIQFRIVPLSLSCNCILTDR